MRSLDNLERRQLLTRTFLARGGQFMLCLMLLFSSSYHTVDQIHSRLTFKVELLKCLLVLPSIRREEELEYIYRERE